MTKKYIELEAVIAAIEKPKVTPGGVIFDALKKACQEEVRNLPAADVVEVRHGHWTKCREGLSSFSAKCSECTKRTLSYFHYNYCPNCGAKMEGGQDTNDIS